MALTKVTVCDGKYTMQEHAPGRWEALRHGEHWPAMASGPDNLHVALAVEVDALVSVIEALLLNDTHAYRDCHKAASEAVARVRK